MKKLIAILMTLCLLVGLFATVSAVAEEPEKVYGGILHYAAGDPPRSVGYTPLCTPNSNWWVLNAAYESLLYYDVTGNLVPRLATSYETDPEEPSVTWHLREGVKFTDGTDFNAEAVKVNIEEYQKNSRSETSAIASVEVIDDYTVKMLLTYWDLSILDSVGYYVYYMSPTQLAADVDYFNDHTCGTGAFILTDYTQNIIYKYTKNENYWREGMPYLDGVEVHLYEEQMTKASAFQAGELDIAHFSTYSEAFMLMNSMQPNWKLDVNESGIGLVMTGIIPNSAKEGPWQDYRVRQALCYAIDAKQIAETCTYGIAANTNQWAAPGSITYDEDLVTFSYNPEKAKELLAEAGYPDGFSTTITTNAMNKEVFSACAAYLEQVGIHCDINLVDNSENVSLYSTGEWEGLMGHFASCGPDLGLYMGRHLSLDGSYYAKGIQHPDDAMELLAKIKTSKTREEKLGYEHEMQKLMYDAETGIALFGLPIYVEGHSIFSYDYVHDADANILSETISFWQIWMDK